MWNPAPSKDSADGKVADIVKFNVNSNKEYSEVLCKPDLIKNTVTPSFAPKSGTNKLDTAVGISLDGVPLYPNLEELVVSGKKTDSYIDAWFPKSAAYTDWKTYFPNILEVDTCLGSISSSGEYHFRSAT